MSKNDKKLAYPVAPSGSILQRPRDVQKWIRTAQEIQKYVNQGHPVNKSFEYVTRNWEDMERYDFHHWIKFYQENAHEKYKMAKHEKEYLHLGGDGPPMLPMDHLKAKLPSKPSMPFMERFLEIQNAEDEDKQAEEEAEALRKEELRKKVKSLDSRLRSALKLMSDPDVQRELGSKMDISIGEWIKQLQDLQRYILLVPSKIKHAQSLDDLIYMRANWLTANGSPNAGRMLTKVAQVAPPPVEELEEEVPAEDDQDLPEGLPEEGDLPEGEDIEMPDLEEVTEETDHSAMIELMKLMNGFDRFDSSDVEDDKDQDDLAHLVVREAQGLPTPDRMSPKNQPEFVVEDDPDMPHTKVTVQKIIERFEGISNILKNREIPRQFGIADIELNELGMASYFPSLAEALKSALDSNQYMLTRVEDILSKLRGSVPPAMDIDLDSGMESKDPTLEAVRTNLEQEEQQEKAQAEKRRQNRLNPPDEDPAPVPTPSPELEGPVEVERAAPARIAPER